MNNKYLVISRTEDEPSAHILLSKAALEKLLNEKYNEGYSFLKSSDLPRDLNYFPSWSVFIMEGEIRIPTAVQEVTKLKI